MTLIERIEAFVRARWIPEFRYVVNTDCPWAPFEKELKTARFALVNTGGIHRKTDLPFSDNFGLGDPSYREIPRETPTADLTATHAHYDLTHALKDVNCVFPIDRFRELEAEGIIGSLVPTHYSFMGYIPIPKPLTDITAPEVARKMKREEVDAAFLTPSS